MKRSSERSSSTSGAKRSHIRVVPEGHDGVRSAVGTCRRNIGRHSFEVDQALEVRAFGSRCLARQRAQSVDLHFLVLNHWIRAEHIP